MATGYSLALLRENLGALRLTKSVRVYLDACFTGTSDGGRLVEGSVVYETPSYPEEVADTMMMLTAVKGTQIARWDREAEHGLFTDQLLDALYGGGDADGDGAVTAGEVQTYLNRFMSGRAWELHKKAQDAVLTTRSPLSDLVLASAGPGGVFPPRPSSDGGPTRKDPDDDGAGTSRDDSDDVQPDTLERDKYLFGLERAFGSKDYLKVLVYSGKLEELGGDLPPDAAYSAGKQSSAPIGSGGGAVAGAVRGEGGPGRDLLPSFAGAAPDVGGKGRCRLCAGGRSRDGRIARGVSRDVSGGPSSGEGPSARVGPPRGGGGAPSGGR